jgi:hypothetical protein
VIFSYSGTDSTDKVGTPRRGVESRQIKANQDKIRADQGKSGHFEEVANNWGRRPAMPQSTLRLF